MSETKISDQHSFAIGEVVYVASRYGRGINEATITDGLEIRYMEGVGAVYCYELEIPDMISPHCTGTWLAEPWQLRKKRPPSQEDHQLTTWEKCVWQPKQVQV